METTRRVMEQQPGNAKSAWPGGCTRQCLGEIPDNESSLDARSCGSTQRIVSSPHGIHSGGGMGFRGHVGKGATFHDSLGSDSCYA